MKKYPRQFAVTILCSTTLLLSACGGGNSSSGEELAERGEIELVGIPRSVVSAVCLDANENALCDEGEALDLIEDTEEGTSIYDFSKEGASQDTLLLEIGDPAKISAVEEYTLAFDKDSPDLSIEALLFDSNITLDSVELQRDFFDAFQKNLNLLANNGVDTEEAIAMIKGKMAQDWTDAGDSFLNEEVDIVETLTYSESEAYEAAVTYRGEDKALVNDTLVASFQCQSGELRTVQHYGIEDIFSLNNGLEAATPSMNVSTNADIVAYNNNVNAGFAQYDGTNNNRFFAENVTNLPAGITKGRFYIGLKSNGSTLQGNDTIHIGDYDNNHYGSHLEDLLPINGGTWSHQLVGNTNPTTDIYWNDFSALSFSVNTNTTLFDYVQTNNHFDVVVEDDTSVDFITVATCSKQDPIAEIKPILENFQCKADETKRTIVGGAVDAFLNGGDSPATPSSDLVNATSAYPSTDYDSSSFDKFFIETLTLPSDYISNARLSMGVKSLSTNLHGNDTLNLGYTHSSDLIGFQLYGNASNSVNNQWNVTPISNNQRLIQTDFNFNTASGANALTWLRGESELDIVVEDDTAVDFVQLDLCTRETAPCIDTDGDGICDDDEKEAGSDPENPNSTPDDIDGDGVLNEDDCDPNNPEVSTGCTPKLPESCNTAINVDLRSANSWLTTAGVAPTENNVFDGTQWEDIVWDGDMNWFDFGNAANAEHRLNIDFCSCGGGDISISNMKSDNYASVTLDNNLPAIVERTDYSQSTMANWGPDVSGSKNIPFTGNGVDHSLIFKVTNQGGPSGGAIDGTLNFIGHLGACTSADVL